MQTFCGAGNQNAAGEMPIVVECTPNFGQSVRSRECVQEEAVAYALDHLEERTWAVVALDEADSGRVDYTIRMNFTVLPNTNERVDMISIGLDPRYSA